MVRPMSERYLLLPERPGVDPARVGISYAGAGPLLVVELGIARALIRHGVVPAAVAGVSAGAFTGLAHVLDPAGGRGVEVTAGFLGGVRTSSLGLRWWQVALHLLAGRWGSLGDNARLRPRINQALRDGFGLDDPRLGDLPGPPLHMGAADRIDGEPVWFPPDVRVVDGLLASSAIPAVFPWRELEVGGRRRTLIDGGIVSNQPLSRLVAAGCGTIIAVSVTPPHFHLSPPTNLIDNATGAAALSIHRQELLEAAYVRTLLGEAGRVLTIRPDLAEFPIKRYDFTPALVDQIMTEAERQADDQLTAARL
jgi:predicted acylesterase/phospholipase RssA